jgi:hypothetical protein
MEHHHKDQRVDRQAGKHKLALRFCSARVRLPLAAPAALEGFSLIGREPIMKRETVALWAAVFFIYIFNEVMIPLQLDLKRR